MMAKLLMVVFAAAVVSWGTVYSGECGGDSFITINSMNCSQYIAADPCNCKRTISGLDINMVCCASCENVMLDDCCKDRVTPENPLQLPGGPSLTSCDMVGSDYQTLCNQDSISGELGLCCETCAQLGDCLNKNVQIGVERYDCEQYVALDPCHCTDTVGSLNIAEACCDACKDIDTTGCDCRDKLSDTNTFTYTVTQSDGSSMTYKFTSCSDMVMKAGYLCHSQNLKKDVCCKSCKGVCEDNPFFRRTVTHVKNGNKCKKCTCDQIRAFHKKTAKKVCKKDKKVKKNCCAMCQEFKK